MSQVRPVTDEADEIYESARNAALRGDHELALDRLRQARLAYERCGQQLSALRTELGKVNVLADMSRTQECIDTARGLRQELMESEDVAVSSEGEQLRAWLRAAAAENLGAALELAGQHTEAAVVLHEALTLYETVGSNDDFARIQASLAVQALSTGSPQEALDALEAARRRSSAGDDDWFAQRCRVFEAQALAMLGRYRSALATLHLVDGAERDHLAPGVEAAVAAETATPDELRAHVTRTEVLLRLNLLGEVLEICGPLGQRLTRLGLRREAAVCRHVEAQALLASGRAEEARASCLGALELFEASALPVLAAHVRITLAQCETEPDKGFAEIDRAIAVLSLTGERPWIAEAAIVGAGIAAAHRGDARSRRRRYLDIASTAASQSPEVLWRHRWHQSELETAVDRRKRLLGESLQILSDLRADLELDHHRIPFMVQRREPLESMIRLCLEEDDIDGAFQWSASHRSASLSKPVQVPTDSAAEDRLAPSQPKLDQHQRADSSVPLLYQTVGDQMMCFIGSTGGGSGGPQMVDLGSVVDEVRDLAVQLQAEWRHAADPLLRRHVNALQPVTERLLRRLHDVLLRPVEPHLPLGPVTVVPVGELASVPFGALHDGTQYHAARRAISMCAYLPMEPRSCLASPKSRPSTLVVGVPDDYAPEVAVEARLVADVAEADLLLGPDATVAAVKRAIASADIIHLAGHSSFRPENPWLSSFEFADRSVTAAEISRWDLRGKTVVLASCSSAQQRSFGEDEFSGLPRSLIRSGAADLLVNLWQVDDSSSVEQMAELHAHLRDHNPAEALRIAQRAGASRRPHPYFWASMVHYANPHHSHEREADVAPEDAAAPRAKVDKGSAQ